MALTTNIKVVQATGFGTPVIDENLGTGDGSTNNYNLANTNVISDSYTISYADSGSNSFTDLTETTDYSLDKQSGRIVLTASGLSATNAKIIYAKYTFIDDFPTDDYITDMRTRAEAEVVQITGQKWETETITEYHDGEPKSNYPTTNFPWDHDYERRDEVNLRWFPVQYVNKVQFLLRGDGFDKVFNYDASDAEYTDITDDINSPSEDDVTLFDADATVNDIVYYGNSQKFLSLQTVLNQAGTGNPTTDWEYYNDVISDYTTLSVTASVTGADVYTASGKVSWDEPPNWGKTTESTSNDIYFVRSKLTANYTVKPIAKQITMGQNSIINEDLALYNVDTDEQTGRMTFINKTVPEGVRNIKVEYVAGTTSVPDLIVDLATILAGIRVAIALTGGSYNDATSYTVGSKSVGIGEQYVNIREVINQFEKQRDRILHQVGRRVEIGSYW